MAITSDDRHPAMPGPAMPGPAMPGPAMPGRAEDVDYEHLLDDYSHFAPPAEGELLQGHVLKVTDKEVIVDFGYKSEGLVPIEQVRASGRQDHGAARRRDRRDDRPRRRAKSKATSCCRTRKPRGSAPGTRWRRPFARTCWFPAAFWAASRAACRWTSGVPGVHARLAGRRAARAQPGFASSARTFRSRSSS